MRKNLAGAAVSLACLTPAAYAAPLLATNVPGIFTYPMPPAGFDAHHASPAVLASYGYPPKPRPIEGDAARGRWEAVVRAVRVAPVVQETSIFQGAVQMAWPPVGTNQGATQYSNNWSGEVLQGSGNGFGPGALTAIAGTFNVPVASQAFGVCTGSWDYLSTWSGIDGFGSADVFQAGVESDAYCANGSTQQYYTAWVEWYPAAEIRITSLPVAPGDVVLSWMLADSATTGRAILVNETTNTVVITSLTAPINTSLKGNCAEWIMERPTINKVTATMSNYVEAWLSDENAVVYGNAQGGNFGAPPAGTTSFLMTMLDASRLTISYAAPSGNTAAVFKDEGSAK